ncbi:hypothetical protein [Streptomyces microflavus]|uniref:hypothetical protein n=1 Tax=Streptomyces microflavus TaxID=1919 RepID=UPI002E33147F|nr:hypothetical protein [Streptomyces microflavus]
MTTKRIPLDDHTSDTLDQLYADLDRVRNAWQESRARWWKANARIDELDARVRELEAEVHRYEEVVVGDLNEANIGLQREVARLTAGQCLDSRAMCEKHHLPPVAGCPYPRCRAARGDQPTPAPRTPGVIDLPDISNA